MYIEYALRLALQRGAYMSTCLVSTGIGMQDVDNMAVVLRAERHQLADKVIRLLNVVGIVE